MSKKVNEKRAKQLGMPHGTANARLRKSLLFSLVQRLEEDICYRCKSKIESLDELSIEHKEPWMDSENPIELFFDLSNIAFSHLNCNISSARKPLRKYFTREERLEGRRPLNSASARKNYCPEKRREKYLTKGY